MPDSNVMKYLIFLVISFFLSLLFTYIGPWWLIIIAPLALGFFLKLPRMHAFLMGGSSIILFWAVLFVIRVNVTGTAILERIAYLLPVNGSKGGLIFLTLLIGGLLGGLASLNGAFWRKSMGLNNEE